MRVVVTGMGAVSSLGAGVDTLWQAIEAGEDGLRPVERFDTSLFRCGLGGMVPGFDEPTSLEITPATAFARRAAEEALAHAGLDLRETHRRVAFLVGTSVGNEHVPLHCVADEVADALGLAGPRVTVGTACSASTNAIALAWTLLRQGHFDAVLCGGTAALTAKTFAGFHTLGALCDGKSAPFSLPIGVSLGEGAGLLVLETLDAARTRGAHIVAELVGCGMAGDAHHETAPDPTGGGVARGLRAALSSAGLAAAEVTYVNAHGTGTKANDAAEWRAFLTVFGPDGVLTSSTKGHLGHAQAAAGALEVIVTIEAIRRSLVPPTLRFTEPRPGGPVDPVGQARPRPWDGRFAASTNAAFGGSNAALIVAPFRPPWVTRAAPAKRPLFLRGVGSVGPWGSDASSLFDAVRAARPLLGGVAADTLRPALRTVDTRGLAPSSCLLIAAATLAIRNSGLHLPRAARDETGILVACSQISPHITALYNESIAQRGFGHTSPGAFAQLVLNAPAGACAKVLSLRGPNLTLSMSTSGAAVALVLAADLLASRHDLYAMVTGGFHELPAESTGAAEGGCCALVSTEPPATHGLIVAGWALAAPGDATTAAANALVMAGLDGSAVSTAIGDVPPDRLPDIAENASWVDLSGIPSASGPLRSGIAVAMAEFLCARGEGPLLLAMAGERSAACALVLVAR